MQPKTLFIVGPTGVGKTALALSLAQKFKGALISADSVQVYKGLDIISGKDLPADPKDLPEIYLIDILEPTASFTAYDFKNHASKFINRVLKQEKLPIVVGGTGLYVKTLIEGLETIASPDLELRKQLDNLSVSELQNKLQKANPEKIERMNDSDKNNSRRLIRALEIASHKSLTTNHQPHFDSLVIGLSCEREVLKQKIDRRVEERLKNGALKEAEGLFANYKNLSQQVKDANGYKQLFAYFKKEVDFDEAVYRWKISEYRHAKNQMTWFKKYGNAEWFDIQNSDSKKQILNKIDDFLKI